MEVAQPLPEHQRLTDAIKNNLHLFTVGSEEIQQSALAAAKATFDSALSQENDGFGSIKHFVRSLSSEMGQQPRETRAQKQARAQDGEAIHPKMSTMLQAANRLEPTPLSGLFVEGMGTDQLWSQLELRAKGICELVNLVFEGEYPDPEALEKESSQEEGEEDVDEMEVDDEEWDDEDYEMEGEEEEEDASSEGSNLGEHITPLSGGSFDPSSRLTSNWDLDLDGSSKGQKSNASASGKRKGPRHPTLDDDFFSISEFNREIDSAEAKSSSRGRLQEDSDEEGSVDLFADVPEDLSEDSDENDNDDASIMYDAFFDKPAGMPKSSAAKARPAKKDEPAKKEPLPGRESKVRFHEEVKVKLVKSRRNPLSLLSLEDDDDSDEELPPFEEGWEDEDEDEDGTKDSEEGSEDSDEGSGDDDEEDEEAFDAIERTKDDLFAEDDAPETDLSTFAQRQQALKKQIEDLELENVGKKDWTLMGEAGSRSRPLNSLLEEDLEFEHRQRVKPVITEEKVKSLEDLIKARILENRYDDVVRRKAFDDKPFLPSKLFELQDTKSAQSLAQIYEEEYTSARTGGSMDDRDGKLKKEHDELEMLWENISSKLDALCNAHFTPKASKGVISTIANVPTTTLESALPTTKTPTSLLAPEEIFSSRAPGAVPSKAEMSSHEKQALRLKVKKSKAKMRARLDGSVDKFAKMQQGNPRRVNGSTGTDGAKAKKGKMGREKEEKAAALRSVVKSGKGVTVVGKGSGKEKKRK